MINLLFTIECLDYFSFSISRERRMPKSTLSMNFFIFCSDRNTTMVALRLPRSVSTNIPKRYKGLFILSNRPYLNAAKPCSWNLGGDLDRFVQIPGFNKIVATKLLFGLHIRPISGRDFAVSYSNCYCGIRGKQSVAVKVVSTRLDIIGEPGIFLEMLFRSGFCHLLHNFYSTDQA